MRECCVGPDGEDKAKPYVNAFVHNESPFDTDSSLCSKFGDVPKTMLPRSSAAILKARFLSPLLTPLTCPFIRSFAVSVRDASSVIYARQRGG